MRFAVFLIVWGFGSSAALAQVAVAPTPPSADKALLDLAKLGRITTVQELVTQAASVDVEDARGFTPLLWASAGGYAALVRALLDAGAEVNHQSKDGTTALMLASANGFAPVASMLVSAGAAIDTTRGGLTARALAEQRGRTAIVEQFDQIDELARQLREAVAEGHDALVRQLIALGAPPDEPDAGGVTPVMVAARNGDLGILQHLVSRHADLGRRDTDGRTSLDWAALAPLTAPYVSAFIRDRTSAPAGPRPAAPTRSYPSVAESVRDLSSALSRVPLSSPALRRVHRTTSARVDSLLALAASWPAQSPEDYRMSMAALVSELEAALSRGDLAQLATLLEQIDEDLDVKLEHCLRSGGALGGSVAVSVRTLRAGAEITDWQVFYIPKIFEASPSASPDLFPQLSSPTEDVLVPGRYVMWVRDPSTSQVGERTVVKVGEGRKELLVELPVPAHEAR